MRQSFVFWLAAFAFVGCGDDEKPPGETAGRGGDAGQAGHGAAGGSGGRTQGGSSGNGMSGNAGSNAGDGASGDGASGDGASGDGAGGDGASGDGAGGDGAGAGGTGGKGDHPVGDKPIDDDHEYADGTDVLYLSGKGSDDAVNWDFMLSTGSKSGVWSTLPVPSNWEFHGFGTFQYGFSTSNEVGTYRRTFERPAGWAAKRVSIVFEGSMTDTHVSLNGASAGPVHQGGFYRFEYDVTDLLQAGANQLEVVVAKQSADASVNAAEREADYWTFGGIFRPVYLEATPPAAIERIAIDARANGALSVDVHLVGLTEAGTIRARVFDDDLNPVGEPMTAEIEADATEVSLSGMFPNIEAWSAEWPRRYRLAVELETSAGTRHAVRENFGFRTLEVRPGDGIYVNGKRVLLRGANRHSFWPESGRALNADLSAADVQILKDMNMNAVRSSHYPPDKHFLDECDAMGLYVIDELGGWQGPPYDTGVGRKLVEEMVTFDLNHPSIVFWANGNEGGWNTALDADYPRLDPQQRPVLHPWATFSNINTDHYESYANTTAILGGTTLFMPTEFLHGLYDGGGGAGLDDYWHAIFQSPRGAGGFLWAFVDEGVRRSPTQIDTAGNAAPDGILGPYREKEGSFYTIRQVWSPVQIALTALPPDFDGAIEVENHYDETNLDTVSFGWKLVRFDFRDPDAGHTVLTAGSARTGSIEPRASGALELELPASVGDAHALLLDATDATGRLIGKWSWMIPTPSELRTGIVPEASTAAAVANDDGTNLTVTAAESSYTFAKNNGQLIGVSAGDRVFSLRNGPSLSVGTAALQSFEGAQSGNDYVITASYTGNLERVEWRVLGNGWLRLGYRYTLNGAYDYFGVDFDCPEADVESVQWLGRGPHRVWKNRMRGPWHDLFEREKNTAITGQRWDYPEFQGYFADVYFARLTTSAGPIEIVVDSPDLFLRLFTPQNGPNPQTAAMLFPARDISFLHGIAPIGDKFLAPASTGPQGARHAVNGRFEASLYFHFGASTP